MADPVFQYCKMLSEPVILIVWPYMVVTISLNVTATLVAAVQELDVLEALAVEVVVPDCAEVVALVAVPVVGTVPVTGV